MENIGGNAIIIKEININFVRKILKMKGQGTKQEIAKETGLSFVTVGTALQHLLSQNEIFETKLAQSSGGRPAQVQGRTGCLDRRGRTRVSALIQKIMYHFKPHCYGKTKRKINLEHHYQSNYCSSHRHRRCAGYSKLYLIFNP